MTDLTTYPGTSCRLVGSPPEVAAMLRQVHDAGRLESLTPPQAAGPGRVACEVRLRPLPRPAARRRRRRTAPLVSAGVGLTALVVTGWWLANHPAVAGALIVAVVAVVAKYRSARR